MNVLFNSNQTCYLVLIDLQIKKPVKEFQKGDKGRQWHEKNKF